MFSLLNPLFLWAAAAAVIPLVLHMLEKRRIVHIRFSTIQFLKLAEKKSSRRIKLENFLLWLIRTLLMLLIAFAFAMPLLRTKAFGSFLSRAQRDVAIVLDGSYSMNYNTGKDTVWNKTLQCAVAIVNGLEDGDRLCIFLAADNVKPVIEQLTGDRAFAIAQLKALEAGTTSSQLCPATVAANDSLMQETRRREREIHIITDGQALPWSSFAKTEVEEQPPSPGGNDEPEMTLRLRSGQAEDGEKDDKESPETETIIKGSSLDLWHPEKIDKRTAFFVTLTGVPAPQNVAPIDIDLQPQLIMSDMPSKVKVKLTHSGPPQNSTVSVYVDDKEMASRATVLGNGDSADATFTLPPLKPGTHAARVETPSDNLPIDNNFYFLIRVKEELPSLCVGSRGDAFYLSKALNARVTSASAMDVKLIGTDELADEDLNSYSCVFLCNALPLPGQTILRVEQYVRAGGLVVIFPGDRATVQDYEPWSCLPGTPLAIKDIAVSARKKMLRWERPQHPILRNLKLGRGIMPLVTIRREFRWEKLHEKAQPLIFAGSESPFLVSRAFGNGRVLFFSVPADRSWSNFPLSSFFLPIAYQVVQYGAGIVGATPYIWAARSFSLSEHLPTATQGSTILDPNKDNISIRSSVVRNKTLLRAENLLTPGVYLLSKPDSTESEPALAINLQRAESDLTPLKHEEIPEIIRTKNVYVAVGKDELLRLVNEHRVGRTLGELMLWMALIVGVVEVFYANWKSKSVASLSETLGIEASGKVKE